MKKFFNFLVYLIQVIALVFSLKNKFSYKLQLKIQLQFNLTEYSSPWLTWSNVLKAWKLLERKFSKVRKKLLVLLFCLDWENIKQNHIFPIVSITAGWLWIFVKSQYNGFWQMSRFNIFDNFNRFKLEKFMS